MLSVDDTMKYNEIARIFAKAGDNHISFRPVASEKLLYDILKELKELREDVNRYSN